MIPTWLVQIGSMAGLFTFAFTVFDRLLAGRPIISLSRSEYGKRNVRCSNPSMSEILIRSIGTFPRHAQAARDDSTKGIIRAAMKGSFQTVCPPESDVDFPIVFLDGQLMDGDALDDSFRVRLATVLKFWVNNDLENIFRIKCGNPHFQIPYEYETNTAGGIGGTSEFGGPFSEQSAQRAEAVLKELLSHITTHHFKNKELVSAAIYATALRRLSPIWKPGDITRHDTFLHQELNNRFGMSPPTHVYQAVDTLRQMLVDKLAEHGISDTG